VAFVSNSARELSDMVDDLLDLAKIEAGRITISPAWFDMFDLFAALRGMFRPIVDATAVDLIFEEPVRFAALVHRRQEARADPAQLHFQLA
jgi:signal transduction histidine kinase